MRLTSFLGVALIFAFSGCEDPSRKPPPKPNADTLEQAARMDRIEGLIEEGSFQQAEELLTQEIASGFTHPRAFLLRAKILQHGNEPERLEEAIGWLDKAINESPAWLEPRWMQAQIFLELRRHQSAITVCESLNRLHPRSPFGVYGLGLVAMREVRYDDAYNYFSEALERNPNHLPTLHAVAHLHQQRNEPQKYQAVLERLLVLTPEDSSVLRQLGEIALKIAEITKPSPAHPQLPTTNQSRNRPPRSRRRQTRRLQ